MQVQICYKSGGRAAADGVPGMRQQAGDTAPPADCGRTLLEKVGGVFVVVR